MLVTQKIGKFAGETVDLTFDAAVSAYRQGTIEVPQDSLALVRKVAFPEPDSGERFPLVTPTADAPVQARRRGGWPLGRPRGPRKPEVLA